MKPRYSHDCDACSFVGQLDAYDIYLCPQGGHPTIVARYGDDGPFYSSGGTLTLFDLGIKLTRTEPI